MLDPDKIEWIVKDIAYKAPEQWPQRLRIHLQDCYDLGYDEGWNDALIMKEAEEQ